MLNLPVTRWYEAIPVRRSRRRYDPRPVDQALLSALDQHCRSFRPFPEARAVLVQQNAHLVFKGALGHYGQVKGAPAFLAFIGDMQSPWVQEAVGYTGEAAILEATAQGLATCWIGAFFRPQVVHSLLELRPSERVLAVSPLGHSTTDWSLEEKVLAGFGRNHKRYPLTQLVNGLSQEEWPHWMAIALEAARLAPSAVNRQPWRFAVTPDAITVTVDDLKDTFGISKRLDCGIAMLHLELGACLHGMNGSWTCLPSPAVARYTR